MNPGFSLSLFSPPPSRREEVETQSYAGVTVPPKPDSPLVLLVRGGAEGRYLTRMTAR
jgi:hypothetical protein